MVYNRLYVLINTSMARKKGKKERLINPITGKPETQAERDSRLKSAGYSPRDNSKPYRR